MSTVDFHLGYRVHSHIFSLSQRIPSILIAEDSRGVGQAEAMGTPVRRSHQSGAEIIASLAQIRDTEGHEIAQAIAAMRERFGVMQEFLQKIA
jgi:ketol-acid reductoisomerase